MQRRARVPHSRGVRNQLGVAEIGPVGAIQVGNVVILAIKGYSGVAAGDKRIGDHDVVIGVAADGQAPAGQGHGAADSGRFYNSNTTLIHIILQIFRFQR